MRISVLASDLCRVSLCGVTNMMIQALSNFIVRGLCCYGAGCRYALMRQLLSDRARPAVVSHSQHCVAKGVARRGASMNPYILLAVTCAVGVCVCVCVCVCVFVCVFVRV